MVYQRVYAVGVKRGLPRVQLVQNNTKAPQIRLLVVGLFLDEFGCHVQRRSLYRRKDDSITAHRPREPEIAQLHPSPAPDQYILRLHVPVDDPVGVEVVQRPYELPRDLLDLAVGESLVVLEHVEQLPLRVLRDHAELPLRLKGVHHQDDVLVVQGPEDADLGAEVLYVLGGLAVLRDELQSDELTGVVATTLEDLAEGTLTDALHYFVLIHLGSVGGEGEREGGSPRARTAIITTTVY